MPNRSPKQSPQDSPGGTGRTNNGNSNGTNGNGASSRRYDDFTSDDPPTGFSGSDSDRSIDFRAIFNDSLIVYRATNNGKFTEKLPAVAVPPEFKHAISRIINKGQAAGVPYEDIGAFVRDSCYHFLRWWREQFAADAELGTMVSSMERLNEDARQSANRLAQDRAMLVYDDEMTFLVQEEAWGELHKRIAVVVSYIKAAKLDPWWYKRWKMRVATSRPFLEAIRQLQQEGYQDTECVNTFSQWIEEAKNEPDLRRTRL